MIKFSKMNCTISKVLCIFFLIVFVIPELAKANENKLMRDLALYGFSTEATGIENADALQKAIDKGGTFWVSQPGEYKIAKTVYVGSNTSLVFGNNVFLKKVVEKEPFSHVFLNKGALTKTYNENIQIEGLNIIVNGVDRTFSEVYGLRGQLAFFYAKNVRIRNFRCLDLEEMQFGIHVCTFEDLLIEDVIIKGQKDGIHLGRGNRFTIRNGVFQTFDDAIALNGHDYATSNPEIGWIENGVIENCYDLNQDNTTGFFCRILAGAWSDWKSGMEVQHSDAVVSGGRIYRVQMQPDGKVYKSYTRPDHKKGQVELDGIIWGVVQNENNYTAGVRNVSFRNIFLEKPRTSFSVHFDNDKYSRSYYPGSAVPRQENLVFDNIRILHEGSNDFILINTPVDVLTISNSSFKKNSITFYENGAMDDYLKTRINIYGCVFHASGEMKLLVNEVKGKEILLKTASNIIMYQDFSPQVISGGGKIVLDSEMSFD